MARGDVYDQRPWECINHYYPVADCHVQMPSVSVHPRQFRGHTDGGDAPRKCQSRRCVYSIFAGTLTYAAGMTRRWPFPGQPPLHFQPNHAGDHGPATYADPI